METNEAMQTTLVQQAEAEVNNLLKRVQNLPVGDLKAVEQEGLASVFELGRRMLGEIMQVQPEVREAPARRKGACGHPQRLVGRRSKQILTLGPVTIERAYYHCLAAAKEQGREEQARCRQGEAPADALWTGCVGRRCGGRQFAVREPAYGTGRFWTPIVCSGDAGGFRARQASRGAGDGARWLWRLVEEHFPGAVQIVDVWHAQEHVWEVAQAVFGCTTPEGISYTPR